jgi:hypothetical protein
MVAAPTVDAMLEGAPVVGDPLMDGKEWVPTRVVGEVRSA